MLTTEQKTKLATKALTSIKKAISERKKDIKAHPAGDPWGFRNPNIDLGITLKHGYTGAKNEKYRLTINPNWFEHDTHIIECDTRSELEDTINILFGLLNQQMKVKGWTTLKVVREKATFGDPWCGVKVTYPSKITLCAAPCKEYKSLQSFINKYGKAKNLSGGYYGHCGNYADMHLGNYDIFHSAMGGKRGRLWDEYGERIYLDNRPKKCAQVLEELRKARGSKDLMLCKMGEEDWIDPVDRAYSERHEVECDGEKRHYIEITITSPTGKVKYNQKIF